MAKAALMGLKIQGVTCLRAQKPPGPGAGRAHRSPSSPPRPLSPRGMVVVADKTAELYEKTYWASYNIP